MTEIKENPRAEIAVVAVAASLSFLACISLVGYALMVYFRTRYDHKTPLLDTLRRQKQRGQIQFLNTQFGALFINLLISDFVQSFGFGLNYYWIGDRFGSHQGVCTVQALAIEGGDVGSAIWSLIIAVHTMLFIVLEYKPPTWSIVLVIASVWILIIGLSIAGPLLLQTAASGPFYTAAGTWCWIGKNYDLARLWFHYLFIFISAAGSLLFYALCFVSLRQRLRSEEEQSRRRMETESGQFSTAIPNNWGAVPRSASAERLTCVVLDKMAKKMLVYPLAYILLSMPLATFRLAGIAGYTWPRAAQSAVGAIFTLSGLVNVLLFGITRGIFRSHSSSPSRPSRPKTAAISRSSSFGFDVSSHPHNGFRHSMPLPPPPKIYVYRPSTSGGSIASGSELTYGSSGSRGELLLGSDGDLEKVDYERF
ncbi:hypothetical protein BT69DRAFT_1353787 [Atractiella rhizophila]|nr:hypothetical protein BT69DRAFT_1353787 [Atractiella rhizophila]